MKIKNKENQYNFKRSSINLSLRDYDRISKIVQNGSYLNPSEFIREAIRLRLDEVEKNQEKY